MCLRKERAPPAWGASPMPSAPKRSRWAHRAPDRPPIVTPTINSTMVGSISLCSLALAVARPMARVQARTASVLAPQRAIAASVFAPRPKRAQTARRCFFSSANAQSGLQKDVVVEGSGASPKQGDRV